MSLLIIAYHLLLRAIDGWAAVETHDHTGDFKNYGDQNICE
jgi:hypothetical protein